MFKRDIEVVLERYKKAFPAIGITGPRQSGKTTIAKQYFAHLPYVSLENLDTRLKAQQDPRGFLSAYHSGVILDEIQHVPELLSYLMEIIDNSSETGRFIITGSQNILLNAHIAQSLAGRIGLATLLPLSMAELDSLNLKEPPILKGGYPRIYHASISPMDFYPNYLKTYIERDVRQIQSIDNLQKFQVFLKLCAGRIGQMLNLNELARDASIAHTTARAWISVLEASYIIFNLQPFYKNFSKRLVKSTKLYFYDTGLACSLLGIENETQLESHYLKGALFENIIILELLKHRLNNGLQPQLYFWRDQTGYEIDTITEWGGQLSAFEIKSSMTFQEEYIKSVKHFKKIAPESKAGLIYNGTESGTYKEVALIPWKNLSKIFPP